MVTAITGGIQVSVETTFQAEERGASGAEYIFSYRITIENKSARTIQLMRRHWFIFDCAKGWREVEGEGVVGVQPYIEPGGFYQYISHCILQSSLGKMHGTYQIRTPNSREVMEITIPEFLLVVPSIYN